MLNYLFSLHTKLFDDADSFVRDMNFPLFILYNQMFAIFSILFVVHYYLFVKFIFSSHTIKCSRYLAFDVAYSWSWTNLLLLHGNADRTRLVTAGEDFAWAKLPGAVGPRSSTKSFFSQLPIQTNSNLKSSEHEAKLSLKNMHN